MPKPSSKSIVQRIEQAKADAHQQAMAEGVDPNDKATLHQRKFDAVMAALQGTDRS